MCQDPELAAVSLSLHQNSPHHINKMNASFPTTYSILSSEAIAARVLPAFNIGEIDFCRFFTGGFNDTYQVRAVGGTFFYLRIYRSGWRTLPDILAELDILNHLNDKGFSAVTPVPTREGSLLVELSAPEGVRYAALFTGAPGKLISYDNEPEKVAFQYGQAVAELHCAASDFSSQHHRFQIDLDLLIETPLRNISPFLAHRPGDLEYIRNLAGRITRQIVDSPAAALEWGYCHGDLQGYHAHVSGSGILTFFDFDCGGFGYRAYDLAVFRWCARLKGQEAVWWQPYLAGYRAIRPLADLDVQAVPLFVAARYIWHMGVHTQNSVDWGCAWLDDAYFDEKLSYLHAVENDYFGGQSS